MNLKRLSVILFALVLAFCAYGQTATTTPPTGPTYFSTTGARFNYYDNTITETTNLGIRLTKTAAQDVPGGLWTIVSIDATPRSQASTAALRAGARYFLSAVASGNLIIYANIADRGHDEHHGCGEFRHLRHGVNVAVG